MRLLPKSEVDKHKAIERRAEVAEGLKLAKKVDALRQTVADEDKALQDFRARTLEAVCVEIKDFASRRDALCKEVADLEERRVIALVPLDAEWVKVRESEQAVREREVHITEQEKLLHEVQAKVTQQNDESTKKLGNATYLNEQAQILHTRSAILNSDAERKIREADEVRRLADANASVIIANAQQREAWVQEREVSALKKEDELRARELDIDMAWVLLKDRQALLERNIKQHGS